MSTEISQDQLEVEYIQLQYKLADALQEALETPPPYDRLAHDNYDRLKFASLTARQRLSGRVGDLGLRAAPAQ